MLQEYADITSKIKEEPLWYDSNGVPRYAKFEPNLVPDIYSNEALLLKIKCQSCKKIFLVSLDEEANRDEWHSFKEKIENASIGYGDPPAHDCSGVTMCSITVSVEEYWERREGEWKRNPEYERDEFPEDDDY
jgi:hypothetical protein